jgi:hypothetical protein
LNQLQLSSSAVADEAGQKKTTCGTSRQVKSNADDLHADEFKLHSDMRNNECKQQTDATLATKTKFGRI